MKIILYFLIIIFISSCGVEKEKVTIIEPTNPAHQKQIEEKPNVLLQIPNEFILVERQENGDGNDQLTSNYITYNDNAFEAKLFQDSLNNDLIAINNKLEKKTCFEYKSFLLKQDENGSWQNVFDEYYPDLNIYSFYKIEDKKIGQFEGDEKTVFAGYKFHFDETASLGLEFMFCNLNSLERTQKLNENAEVIYKKF